MLNTNLVANSTPFVFDYQNGKYGYNTDTNRGADTFFPFKQSEVYEMVGGTDNLQIVKTANDGEMYITFKCNTPIKRFSVKGYNTLNYTINGSFWGSNPVMVGYCSDISGTNSVQLFSTGGAKSGTLDISNYDYLYVNCNERSQQSNFYGTFIP